MPVDSGLVKQLIEQIEADQAERSALLTLLRKQVGDTLAADTSPVNKNKVDVSSDKVVPPAETKHTEKPKFRLNGNSDPNFVPIATHAIEALRGVGKPLALRDIVIELDRRGIETAKKNFSTSLYTAMMRRKNELRKNQKSEWELVE